MLLVFRTALTYAMVQETRKILFVVHSLGGLLTQNALCLSRGSAEKHIWRIGDCTIAIAFLGTPNFGADLASWAKFGTNIVRTVIHANTDIVSVLRPGSEMLASIQSGFHNILRLRKEEGLEISITCFYEELPLPIVGEVLDPCHFLLVSSPLIRRKVVPKHSAILPGYASYGIHANHMVSLRSCHVHTQGSSKV